jgi:Ca-activated chloride channel family protein
LSDNDEKIVSPIQVGIALSHGVLPANRPGKLWALVELSASNQATEEAKAVSDKSDSRLPLNINVVLDRSGSMGGQPVEQVKQATQFLVEQIGANDVLSITVFNHKVDVALPSQKVTNKDLVKGAIDSIWPGGSTNLSGGLLRGYEEALKECRPGQVNRVLLLTDGMANVGVTNPAALSAKARAMLEQGVSLSTVGVGLSFDEDLLIALAEAGGGAYYYIKDADEIPNVFSAELKGLLSVVAQGITLTVDGLSGCKITGVIGYKPSSVGHGASLALPDMFRDEVKRLAIGIDYPALPEGEHPVLHVALSYTDALHNLAHTTLEVTAKLAAIRGAAEPQEPNFDVIKTVELIQTAVAKDESAKAMDKGDYKEARAILENRIDTLQNLSAAEPMACRAISEEIDTLRKLTKEISKTTPRHTLSETRKNMRSQSYQIRHSQSDYGSKKDR